MSIKNFVHKPDIGLFVLRVFIGGMMIAHGVPKIMGGPDQWEWLGKQMALLGITFFPVFWGFLAALTETLGGLLLLIGFYTRVAAFFLFGVMLVATLYHLESGHGFAKTSHAAELGIVFLALIFLGSGKFGWDRS